MGQQRGIMTIVILVLLIVLPTALSLSYYQITKDPSIRPLGITRESLRAYSNGGEGIGVIAVVDWDKMRSGRATQAEMKAALTNTFKAKGMEVWVVFRESSAGTFISYKIGPSVIGPYPQNRAAEGVNAAVAAYRMHVPYKP